MSRMRAVLASVLAFTFAVAACEGHTSLAPDTESASAASMTTVSGDADDCQATGSGLTAVVVNEDVVNTKVVIDDCDVGAYFDEDGVVRNAEFEQSNTDSEPTEQSLVRVNGADVDVTGSTFHANEDYVHQILHIAYVGGATGKVAGNTLTGFKRVGVLLDGEDTDATVQDNEVVGVGAKSSGWAENGIQVSRGATGTVKNNEVENHWWDANTLSSGLIIFESDGVTAQRNDFTGNDGNILIVGDDNNVIHNTVEATAPDGADDSLFHVGALVSSGANNGLRQNSFSTGSSASAGIWLTGDATNTKLIRNTFSGNYEFGKIVDGGEDTKLPKPFDPNE